TAIGMTVLGFSEQSPLPRMLIDLPPVAMPLVGTAWLFILIKIGLAIVIVLFLDQTVRTEPQEGYILLALVAGVGFGPGLHNTVLFAVAPSALPCRGMMLPGLSNITTISGDNQVVIWPNNPTCSWSKVSCMKLPSFLAIQIESNELQCSVRAQNRSPQIENIAS
ncbi:MAG: DUF63 family protein, partial [Halobacteriaceae archaeon]